MPDRKQFCAHCGEELVKVAPLRHANEPYPAGHAPEPTSWDEAPVAAGTPPEEADAIAPEAPAEPAKASSAKPGKGTS